MIMMICRLDVLQELSPPSNRRKGVKGTSGQGTQRRNTWDLSFRLDDETTEVANPITEKNGVIYEGPPLAHYVNDEEGKPALSPSLMKESMNARRFRVELGI